MIIGVRHSLTYIALATACSAINESDSMNSAYITTSWMIPGVKTVRSLGVVRGISVRSVSALENIGASVEKFFGGSVTSYQSVCEKSRDDAFQAMVRHAESLAANGIINVRYDATAVGEGLTEVIVYGTAVFVQPRSN